ncbi:hypothetical protein [Bacillus sp. AK128]
MKPEIKLTHLDVSSISNSSGIFYGDNKLHFFRGTSVKNEGFGEINGNHNTISDTENALIKEDYGE